MDYKNPKLNTLKDLINQKNQDAIDQFIIRLTEKLLTQYSFENDEEKNGYLNSLYATISSVSNNPESPTSITNIEIILTELDKEPISPPLSNRDLEIKAEEYRKEAEKTFNENVAYRNNEAELKKELSEKQTAHNQEVS